MKVWGLVMTYVDDLFITAPMAIRKAIQEKIQEKWSTSSPQEVTEVPIKFLGMEVSREWEEEHGRYAWLISQASYVEDLLGSEEEKINPRKIPITKDQANMEADEDPPSQADVRSAQKVVGELLWLVTRTRPDMMYAVARMGSNVLKKPRAVLEAGRQAKGYLMNTKDLGLKYQVPEDQDLVINVYTDASYAPNAEESHGCCLVMLGGHPIFWRSGKMSTMTLSIRPQRPN